MGLMHDVKTIIDLPVVYNTHFFNHRVLHTHAHTFVQWSIQANVKSCTTRQCATLINAYSLLPSSGRNWLGRKFGASEQKETVASKWLKINIGNKILWIKIVLFNTHYTFRKMSCDHNHATSMNTCFVSCLYCHVVPPLFHLQVLHVHSNLSLNPG